MTHKGRQHDLPYVVSSPRRHSFRKMLIYNSGQTYWACPYVCRMLFYRTFRLRLFILWTNSISPAVTALYNTAIASMFAAPPDTQILFFICLSVRIEQGVRNTPLRPSLLAYRVSSAASFLRDEWPLCRIHPKPNATLLYRLSRRLPSP